MATTWLSQLRLRLRGYLFQPASIIPEARFKFEGRTFTRPVNESWGEEFLQILSSPIVSVGGSPSVQDRFLYSINLNYPMPASITAIDDLCVAITDVLKPGLSFEGWTPGLFQAFIMEAEILPTVESEGWCIRSIDVSGFTNRTT